MSESVAVAGGLVFCLADDGKPEVLVIDDSFGRVTLPKGHVEKGELIEETALREINEETGIVGRLLCPISRVSYAFTSREGVSGTKDAFYYLVQATGGHVQAQLEEVQGARFVPASEVTRLISREGYPNNVDVFARGLRLIDEWVHHRLIHPEILTLSILSASTTEQDVRILCRQARQYQVGSVCVQPLYVTAARESLQGSLTKVCAAIGYPTGALPISSKVAQAVMAIEDGATEIDMVVAIGQLRDDKLHYIEQEITDLMIQVQDKAIVKVTLETGLLSEMQLQEGARIAQKAGVQVINTSTGFVQPYGSVETIASLKKVLKGNIGIQAFGDHLHKEKTRSLLSSGVTRLVTQGSFRILYGDASVIF